MRFLIGLPSALVPLLLLAASAPAGVVERVTRLFPDAQNVGVTRPDGREKILAFDLPLTTEPLTLCQFPLRRFCGDAADAPDGTALASERARLEDGVARAAATHRVQIETLAAAECSGAKPIQVASLAECPEGREICCWAIETVRMTGRGFSDCFDEAGPLAEPGSCTNPALGGTACVDDTDFHVQLGGLRYCTTSRVVATVLERTLHLPTVWAHWFQPAPPEPEPQLDDCGGEKRCAQVEATLAIRILHRGPEPRDVAPTRDTVDVRDDVDAEDLVASERCPSCGLGGAVSVSAADPAWSINNATFFFDGSMKIVAYEGEFLSFCSELAGAVGVGFGVARPVVPGAEHHTLTVESDIGVRMYVSFFRGTPHLYVGGGAFLHGFLLNVTDGEDWRLLTGWGVRMSPFVGLRWPSFRLQLGPYWDFLYGVGMQSVPSGGFLRLNWLF